VNAASCVADVDWDPTASAASNSQLAGVIAGLVFAGLVVMLDQRGPGRRSDQALTLFVAAFLTFAFDGFFFGVTSGEQTCARAWAETMVAAGVLGFGALGLFLGVSWMLHAATPGSSTPFRVTRVIVYVLAFLVVAQLRVTAVDYLRDVRPAGAYPWLDTALTAVLVLVAVVAAAHALAGRRLARLSRPAVTAAAGLAIAYVVVCSLLFGLITSSETAFWAGGTPPVVYIGSTLTAVLLQAAVVIVHLLALPVPEPGPARPLPRRAPRLLTPRRLRPARRKVSL
jgi:hypothetical protein